MQNQSTNPLLNYHFEPAKQRQNAKTLVFIHGLFGDMNNLNVISREFQDNYNILRVDLRNHGQSFHSDKINFDLMARDLLALLQHLHLQNVILIGHSMGGKTAMKFTALYPQFVERLVVIDIAPVPYMTNRHTNVFNALFAVRDAKPANRLAVKPILAQYIQDEGVLQFILKSFDINAPEYFRFNVSALYKNYAENLMGWSPVYVDTPCLFIKGSESDYILAEYKAKILAQFPQATSFTINGAGHWVHSQKTQAVVRAIEKFLPQDYAENNISIGSGIMV